MWCFVMDLKHELCTHTRNAALRLCRFIGRVKVRDTWQKQTEPARGFHGAHCGSVHTLCK